MSETTSARPTLVTLINNSNQSEKRAVLLPQPISLAACAKAARDKLKLKLKQPRFFLEGGAALEEGMTLTEGGTGLSIFCSAGEPFVGVMTSVPPTGAGTAATTITHPAKRRGRPIRHLRQIGHKI